MTDIVKKLIEVEACGGSHIDDCLTQSMKLSLKEKSDVILSHNGKGYKISYQKVRDFVNSITEG